MEQGGKHSRGEQVALAGLTNLLTGIPNLTNLPDPPQPTSQLTENPIPIDQDHSVFDKQPSQKNGKIY